jgi:hypothetical protein
LDNLHSHNPFLPPSHLPIFQIQDPKPLKNGKKVIKKCKKQAKISKNRLAAIHNQQSLSRHKQKPLRKSRNFEHKGDPKEPKTRVRINTQNHPYQTTLPHEFALIANYK